VCQKMKIHILTEECPQLCVIKYILTHIIGKNVGDVNVTYSRGIFGIYTETEHEIKLSLFKGTTSSVDYIVYVDDADVPVLLIESTKTTDRESRNTSAYQRLIKFIIAKQYYPNSKYVMFYEKPFTKKITKTMNFGMRLLKTMNVEIIGAEGQILFESVSRYENVDELILDKNGMSKKQNNVSVTISKNENDYIISAKLEKSGTFGHDPNKGLVSALCYCINKLHDSCNIVITKHGLKQSMLSSNNKFMYSIQNLQVSFQGLNNCVVSQKPPNYWKIQPIDSEKIASISCHYAFVEDGWKCVFHNHVGSARSYLETHSGDFISVPKLYKIPDIVFIKDNEVLLVEAKNSKTLQKGDEQLFNIELFENLIRKTYKTCSVIKKGLTVALSVDAKVPITHHEIVHICEC